MKKYIFFSYLICLLFGCSNADYNNKKCLSCGFYLAKKSSKEYVLLHQGSVSKKPEVLLDPITNICWQRCYMFASNEDKFWIFHKMEDGQVKKISVSTSEGIDSFVRENGINIQMRLDGCEGIYNILLPVICE